MSNSQDGFGISARKEAVLEALRRAQGLGAEDERILPRNSSVPPPLSYAQQRLWFIEQMEPGSPAFIVSTMLRLRGELRVDALRQAVAAIVQRHEVLRTHFAWVEGEAVQVIEERGAVQLEVESLDGWAGENREAEISRRAAEEAVRPFDLAHGPLLRVRVIKAGAEGQEHVLLLNMHHIVSDGWSKGILLRELSALYAACIEGRDAGLEQLPVQYADFAVWQREWLEGGVLEQQLDYWRIQLHGMTGALELSTDCPRPAIKGWRGSQVGFWIEEKTTEALRKLSQQSDATLFMTLLAGVQALLWRYTGQDDITVGTPIANRNREEVEGLIGFFVNMLVLRTEVKGKESFVQHLRRVREVALGAYEHQDVPFEKLVEELQPERDTSRTALFQITFALQNARSGDLAIEGIETRGVGQDLVISNYDLSVEAYEVGKKLGLVLRYDVALFEVETMERMGRQLTEMLQRVAGNPEASLAELTGIGEAEREQVVRWNQTEREYGAGQSVQKVFEEQVRRSGGSVALVSEGKELSYEELNRRANQMGHYLRQQGVGRETLVGVCVERSEEMVVALLGILKAGGGYVPLDAEYPPERLGYMVQDSGVGVVVTEEKLLERLPSYELNFVQVICLEREQEEIGQQSEENPEAVNGGEDLAYVMYTSGSTGQPKGVMVAHRGITRLVCNSDYVQVERGDRIAQASNNSFDAATFEIWGALLNGGRLVLMQGDELLVPARFEEWAVGEGITTLFLTTALFNEMVRQGVKFAGVKQVLFGGEMVDVNVVRKVIAEGQQQRLLHVYGPTEGTTFSSWHEVQNVGDKARTVPIGVPISNTQAYIVDEELRLAPVGAVGELCLGGEGLGRGYWKQAELTAEKFVPNPYSGRPGARLYRTGDRVRYGGGGAIEFLGRMDEQVKIRGYRIEPGEIERALLQHEGVKEAVVVAREIAGGEKQLVGYAVWEDEGEGEREDLREYLRKKVPEYMVPWAVVELKELPLSVNGKVERRRLPEPEERREWQEREYEGPRTAVEEIVCGIWAEVLRLERVGIGENFFELGGHSLLATQVISRVRRVFETEVALAVIFEEPTVAGLAGAIVEAREGRKEGKKEKEKEGGRRAGTIERVSRQKHLPLSYAQQRLWFIDQLEPGSAAYNISMMLRVRGELQVEALERAVAELVARHEALRTHFEWVEGQAVQVIAGSWGGGVEVVDVRGRSEDEDKEEREEEAREWGREQMQRSYDLGRGPLLRLGVAHVEEEEWLLVLGMHHIVSDGWSMGILLRELTVLYAACVSGGGGERGGEVELRELPVQYADFAVWQREWLEAGELEEQMGYWREQLRGMGGVLELATDYERPAQKGWRGGQIGFGVGEKTTEGLRRVGREADATLFMTLLAGLQALLWRYTGQDDITVGTPIANRNREEIEGLIGFFVNMLVLRTEVKGEEGFGEQLGRVRRMALGAYEHQDVPFEKLVEELEPERDASRTPLFQVTFVLQNAPGAELRLGEAVMEPCAEKVATVKFDLSFTMVERGGRLQGAVVYDVDLFRAETMEAMVRQYEELLERVAGNPEASLAELTGIGEAEREQVVRWNQTEREYGAGQSVQKVFEEQVRRSGGSVALVSEGKELSYEELNRRANQMGHYLQQQGVGRETLVGVCVERSVEMVVTLLGILKAGGGYVPLDAEYPQERLGYMVQDSGVGVVVTEEKLLERLPSYELNFVQVICLEREQEEIGQQSEENPEAVNGGEDLAYVMYTSGSTGQPKGVMIPHRGITRLVCNADYVKLGAQEVLLQMAPVSFDASTFEIWGALLNGGRLVLMPAGQASLEEIGQVVKGEGVTVLWLTAALFDAMVRERAGYGDLSGVKQLLAGGDVVTVESARKYLAHCEGGRLINGYGPTEGTTFSCCHGVTELEAKVRSVPIGVPIGNTQAYIVDEELRLAPVGAVGELCLGGEGLGRGYWKQAELTAEKFVPNPYSGRPGARLYRTGDRVRYGGGGAIEFLGRMDEQVKIRGYRIEPGEIERALLQHEGVKEAVVVARERAGGEKQLVGYVVCVEGVKAPSEELQSYLRSRLPEYMVPWAVVELKELPLTVSGKIDRRALPGVDAGGAGVRGEREYQGPRTEMEEVLCRIWSEVLQVERVGIGDNFFELGGDSILSLRIKAQAQAQGLDFALQALFDHQSIAELAEVVKVTAEAEGGGRSEDRGERRGGEKRAGREPFGLVGAGVREALGEEVEDAYPLSRLQAGMLFHSEYEPESAIYHDVICYRVGVRWEQEALERAVAEVVERHQILRTSFEMERFEEPLQVVYRWGQVELGIEDLRGLEKKEQQQLVQAWLEEEKKRGFEWSRAPLLRMYVHRLGEESFQWSLSFHHAILDGWSEASLMTELLQRYEAARAGKSLGVEKLRASYRDYMEMERDALGSEESQRFWEEMLSGHRVTPVPLGGGRESQSGGIASSVIELEEGVEEGLRELAARIGAPLKTVLLAGHLQALSLLTGSGDVTTGVVLNGRPEVADGDRVLGLFLNLTPLRMKMRKMRSGSWIDLVRATLRVEQQVNEHRRYPMLDLKQKYAGGGELLETAFMYTHFHVYQELPQPEGRGLISGRGGFVQHDLPFFVQYSVDPKTMKIRGFVQHDAGRVNAEQGRRIGRYYGRVLSAMLQEPEGRVGSEELLLGEDRAWLEEVNRTGQEYEVESCVDELFEEQARRRPEAVAVECEGRRMSYGELSRRSQRLAEELRSRGVGMETLVGVCLERTEELVVALLGILKTGAGYVPLDPGYPVERLAYIAADAGLSCIVTSGAQAGLVEKLRGVGSVRRTVCWIDDERVSGGDELGQAAEPGRWGSRDSAGVLCVIYTSGSTGVPKGVVITHRSIVNRLRWMWSSYGYAAEGEVCCQKTSINFVDFIAELCSPLLQGVKLVVLPVDVVNDTEEFVARLEEQEVTRMVLVPSLLRQVLRLAPETGERLRTLKDWTVSGEALGGELLAEFQRRLPGRRLLNLYGSSEVGADATFWEANGEADKGAAPIGRPIANTQVYVLNEEQERLPVGVAGELYIGGAGVERGYLNRAELTGEKFMPDPYGGQAGARMYRSGDWGRWGADGQMEFLGRIDHQVKVRGYRIELEEIEAVLQGHEEVEQAVVGVWAGGGEPGERLVAYVQWKAQWKAGRQEQAGSVGDRKRLSEYLRARLPEYMTPGVVVSVEKLPLNASGKVDRGRLPDPADLGGRAGLQSEYVGPRTGVEEIVSGIWEEVLRVEGVGVHDNFFELGGHSLLATQVVLRVRRALGVELPLRKLFEHPTVAGLTGVIERYSGGGEAVGRISRISREQSLPLSYAQRRLLFIDQLESGSTAYNLSAAVGLRGELRVEALQRAVEKVVERHEVLRTHFEWVEGEPVQVIGPCWSARVEELDVRERAAGERQEAAREWVEKQARRSYDLGRGPLLRVGVVRIEDEEWVLALNLHHIVSDGWSMGILLRELSALYTACLAEREVESEEGREAGRGEAERSHLPELPVQYADYAAWQREWLTEAELARQMEYWREQLRGARGVLELAEDYRRPAIKRAEGRELRFVLEGSRLAGLKKLGRESGATLFMTVLAGIQALLWRYTGQGDISIGTPIANRNREEIEGLIGFFVNMLVLRAEVEGEASFEEHLRRVREVALGAYEHQDVPFEKLVEELRIERDTSRTPVFQVTFALQNARSGGLELEGLQTGVAAAGVTNCNYDLLVEAYEVGKTLRVALRYDVALFAEASIERLGRQLTGLLRRVAENPKASLAELTGIGEAERAQVLEWNRTEREYGAGRSVPELFEEQVRQAPGAAAVSCRDRSVNYAELNRRANQMGHYLRQQGVGRETLVGVCVERSVEMVVALLGILKAGGAYVPLDAEYPQERLAFMLSDSGAQVVITEEKLRERLAADKVKIISIDGDAGNLSGQSSENPQAVNGGEDLAYVMYTSGSAGQPKGVMVAHRGITRLVCNADYVKLGAQEVLLQMAPVSFDASTFEIWGALLNGGRLVLMPAGQASLEEIGKVVKDEAVTVLWLTAALFDAMVRERVEDLSGVKQMLAGGDVVTVESARKYLAHSHGGTLINGYGPTEGTTFSCCHGVRELAAELRSVPIGRPIGNTQGYIVDQELQLAPVGAVGELCLGGEGLGRGYWKQAELTAEKFMPNLYSGKPGARLYRTGDRVRYGPAGAIEFLGRMDEQVKIRGYRIEPGEIERALLQHEGVKEAVMVAREKAGGEKHLVGYVVCVEGVKVASEELQSYLRSRLPEYMVPWALVEVTELPLTASGKIDRRKLPDVDQAGAKPARVFEGPRTTIEEILCSIWAELLQVEPVGIHDNFFEAGGHSLLATRVISRVRKSLRVDLPLRTLFENPTVAGLAEAIHQHRHRGESERRRIEQVSREQRLPLSYAQRRLWFIHQMEPGSAAYNISTALRLKGKFRIDAMQQAVEAVVQRHEALRTHFAWAEGEPIQVIELRGAVSVEVEDLRAEGAEREALIRQRAAQQTAGPFDLASGPLLRVRVLEVEPQEYVLLLCMHHIVSDGWSMGILLRELSALYEGYIEGREAVLRSLPVQYADFAVWQRGWLNGGALETQMGYWRKQLQGTTGVLELPTDYRRSPVKASQGRDLRFGIDGDALAGIKRMSRQTDTTLFMILLAGLQALLWRYSGQEDISVGTPIANRNQEEIEGLIGFFVNMLVMRMEVRGNESIVEHLRRVREVTLGAYEHQDVPFEKLVEELHLERDMSRTPLFQVTLVLQNAGPMSLELEGLAVSGVRQNATISNYDLSVEAYEVADGLGLVLRYDVELFAEETIARMGRQLTDLLRQAARRPEARISELTVMAESERQKLLQWNQTAREYGTERSVQELFEEQAQKHDRLMAVVSRDESLSYGELNRRANQLAHYLREKGVTRETPVGICVERSPQMVMALLAILKSGGAYVPLDAEYPRQRLDYMVRDSRVRLVLTGEKLRDRLPLSGMEVISLDGPDAARISRQSEANPAIINGEEDLAYVMYTSGSTGEPKGVMIPHRGINRLVCNSDYVQLGVDDRIAQVSNNSFDAATFEIWGSLLNGGRAVLMEGGELLVPARFEEWIESEGVTTLFLTTALFNEMVRQGAVFAGVKQVLFGGEMVDTDVVRKALEVGQQTRLLHVYGPTEGTTFSSWHEVNEVMPGARSVAIGKPIANTQAYILDEELQLTPVGVPGELCIGGIGLGRGYWNQAALTAEKFVPDPYSGKPGARLYRTGDRVRYVTEGAIEFLGRLDDQVKIRGYRIEPGEIETVLSRHEGVKDAVVVVREGATGAKQLIAYVVPNGIGVTKVHTSHEHLREYLRENLPEYMVPWAIVELRELPLTPNGKVDRRRLPNVEDSAGDRSQQMEYEGPRTEVEEILCGIWKEVLQVERVGIRDDFFELGGHSLLATRVVSRVRRALQIELPLRKLFEESTVAGLSEAIELERKKRRGQSGRRIDRASREQRLPLSYAQRRLWFIDQLEPGSTAYNINTALRLNGILHIEALRQAVEAIVQRHEVLRTHFAWAEGEPVQIIEEKSGVQVELESLRGLPAEEWETEVRRRAGEEAGRSFDLGRGPLFRVRVLEAEDRQHVLLLSMHHIVSDGWSAGILLRELSALYEAFVSGAQAELTELPVQYADFAAWQRQWLDGGALEQQLSYWREQLRGSTGLLELPADYRRPAVKGWRGAVKRFVLAEDTTDCLKALSQRAEATLFMTLLAGLQALLWRYTSQRDISLGTPIANRNREEIEGLIGFFVNMLVMRTEVQAEQSFIEHLQRVREMALGAYEHQDVPFEKLVDEMQIERDTSRTPLFQVTFALQNARVGSLSLEGVNASVVSPDTTIANYDLSVEAYEVGNALGLVLRYDVALFTGETIERMGRQLTELLQRVAKNSEAAISELTEIGDVEREHVLEWNRTEREYGAGLSVQVLFEDQTRRNPDQKALVYAEGWVSYGELNQRANQLAHYLQRQGVARGTLVGVCVERSVEMVVALLGILKAGGAYVPLDAEYPQERLGYMVQDSGVGVVVTEEKLLERLPSYELNFVQVICLEREREEIAQQSKENPQASCGAEDLAYVMYTSGSTGQPKGVMIPHRGITRLVCNADYVKLGAQEVLLQMAPVSFDASTFEIWGALLNGGRLVLMPAGQASLEEIGQVVKGEGVTVLWLTAALFDAMVRERVEDLSGVKQMLAGGDVVTVESARKYLAHSHGGTLINGYGPTEGTTFSCCHGVTELEAKVRSVPIGVPIGNTQAYIVDEELRLAPVGAVGELCLGGEGLGRGYWKQPELTAEKFMPNLYSGKPGARLYRTGDRVRYGHSGAVEFLGRIDQQIKIRGYRIEPGEIEAALLRHVDVNEAVVVVKHGTSGEKHLVAYVVRSEREDAEAARPINGEPMREYLRGQLPEYMVPWAIVELKALPLTANGKVDRKKLPAVDEAGAEHERQYEGPRTIVEELLCGIWSDVLQVERVGIHDNFFELGGDSILSLRIKAQAQARGLAFPLQALFDHQTIAELAGDVTYDSPHPIKDEARPFDLLSDDDRRRLMGDEVDV